MKAPDKIFLLAIPHLPSEKIGEIADEWSEKPFEGLDNLEYIRKEALMEWAKEQFDILNKQTLYEVFWGQRNAFKQLIDKLNSM